MTLQELTEVYYIYMDVFNEKYASKPKKEREEGSELLVDGDIAELITLQHLETKLDEVNAALLTGKSEANVMMVLYWEIAIKIGFEELKLQEEPGFEDGCLDYNVDEEGNLDIKLNL